MRRTWIKLYVDQILRGSCFNELLPDERFVWFGFLLLAGDNICEGEISVTETIGYTEIQIAQLLKCDVELIKRSIKKMIEVDKISILDGNVIKIVNWQKYQSEYERLKKYKGTKKSTTKSTKKSTSKSITLDIDIDKDIDNKNKKEKKNKKIKHRAHVFLTEEEHKKLIEQLGEAKTNDMIERLDLYIGSKGDKYKSHYMTILNWLKMDKDKGNDSGNSDAYNQAYKCFKSFSGGYCQTNYDSGDPKCVICKDNKYKWRSK